MLCSYSIGMLKRLSKTIANHDYSFNLRIILFVNKFSLNFEDHN